MKRRPLTEEQRQVLRDRMAHARTVKAERVRLRREAEAARIAAGEPVDVPQKGGAFDIIKMIRDPEFIGDDTLSVSQAAFLKAVYGLRMTSEEREAWDDISEGREPHPGGYAESSVVVGTGGGKTKLGAFIAVFESVTFDTDRLTPGETGVAIIIAQDERGTRYALDYCEGFLRILSEKGWKVLTGGRKTLTGAKGKDVVGGEIRVKPNIAIRAYPCKKASTRGASAFAAILDEIAWWRTEPNAYNSDREIMRAVRGRRRSHTPILRIVKISSPFVKEGVLWDDFQGRASNRKLVVQAPTWVFNPSLTRESMAEEENADPDAFMRDRGAQFQDIGEGVIYISGALADKCMNKDRPAVLLPRPGVEYFAALDVGLKKDLFAWAVGHEDGEKAVLDLVSWRIPQKNAPLDPEEVAEECAIEVLPYTDVIVGDQYCDIPIQKDLAKNHLRFVLESDSERSNPEMFKNLRATMIRGQVELPYDTMIRKDLTSLVKTIRPGGKLIRVAAPDRSGMHDDISKVIAKVVIKVLPRAGNVDLAALNRGAVPYEGLSEDARRTLLKRRQEELFTVDHMNAVY